MSDFNERLRAADPVAGTNYEMRDPNAVMARIMTPTPRVRRHVLRSFQLRMAGAVAMASLLTVGGIAALENAGPALQVFALSATSTHQTKSTTKPGTIYSSQVPAGSDMMRIYEEFNFTAGPNLSASAGSGAAYQLSFPTSGSAEDSRVAAIFGVSGAPVDQNGDGSDWTINNANGGEVDYANYGGVPEFQYNHFTTASSTSVTSDGGAGNVPSQSTLEGDVQNYLGQLGYGYQVANPSFSTQTDVTSSPGQADVTTYEESVDYTVVVDGMTTDQNVSFTVDQNNSIVSANGPAFTTMPVVQYPLQSPVAAVTVLEAQQQSLFANGNGSGGSVEPLTAPTTTSPAAGTGTSTGTATPPPTPTPGSNDTTTTAPSGPPIVNVTLDSDTVSLQSYVLTDNSVWLLPIYTFTGTVTNADGTTYTSTWSTIAVDPAYIQAPVSTGGINPGGPILY
ncbi:MAG TPA: hypothetical protein VIJ99_07045 [Acidimicrobiales bacterium]